MTPVAGPLRDVRIEVLARNDDANLSLLTTRLALWDQDEDRTKEKDKTKTARLASLDHITQASRQGRCAPGGLLEAVRRRRATACSVGATLTLTCQTRLIVGGTGGPDEARLALRAPYGVPVIPGSALKGLAVRWARRGDANAAADAPPPEMVFGAATGRGSVTILDAIGNADVRVEADVLTPHSGDYYAGAAPPVDYLTPVPVTFLVVKAGSRFTTHITGSDRSAVDAAVEWLTAAIEEWGAGGKTSAGYGYMKVTVQGAPG